MDPDYQNFSEKEMEFIPFQNEHGTMVYERKKLYQDGELVDFVYRKSENEILTDLKMGDYEKRKIENMKVLGMITEEEA
jgi:hypothetical protein